MANRQKRGTVLCFYTCRQLSQKVTYNKKFSKRLHMPKVKCHRKLLHISYRDLVTNNGVHGNIKVTLENMRKSLP